VSCFVRVVSCEFVVSEILCRTETTNSHEITLKISRKFSTHKYTECADVIDTTEYSPKATERESR